MNKNRLDELDPLDYTDEMPSLMSAWGRVDIHSLTAKFLSDSKIQGVYIEFGVGKGRSAVSAIRAYTRLNLCEHFYLFDSFCGLPKLDGPDKVSNQFNEGDYAFSKEDVIRFIEAHEIILDNRVGLIEGWISDTFGDWSYHHKSVKAAVVHIDVDLYSSCCFILEHLRAHLQNGTVILFDDWNCFKASSNHGERKAVKEWLASNPDIQLHTYTAYGWHGHCFIVEISGEDV